MKQKYAKAGIVAHNGDNRVTVGVHRAPEETGMAMQKEAFHQASPAEVFLMNCWYVAAWDRELIDGRLLARTILG